MMTEEYNHFLKQHDHNIRAIPFNKRLPVVLVVALCLVSFTSVGGASSPWEKSSSVPVLPIEPHSSFSPVNSQFGLLANGDGAVRIVEFPRDLHQAVVLGRKSNAQRPISHVKASALTVILVGLLINNLRLLTDPNNKVSWGLFAVVLGLYFLEAFFSSTRKYLSNMSEPATVLDKVATMKEHPPSARWDLECFHHQNGYRTTSSRPSHNNHQKVVTYRARQFFVFREWKDLTSIAELVHRLEYDPLKPFLKITFTKLIAFVDEATCNSYVNQHSNFIAREGNRDIFMDTTTSLDFVNFLPKMLAVRTMLHAPTGTFRMSLFWFFTCILCTVPYRMWFATKCDEFTLVLTKEVHMESDIKR